jgi:hypothetical protein
MSVSLDNRLLVEPNVDGVTRTARRPGSPRTTRPRWATGEADRRHVFLAQYGENGLDAKLKRKFERLDQYGEFASAGTRTWDPMNDPFYPLVMKGGLRELPRRADQGAGLAPRAVPRRQGVPSGRRGAGPAGDDRAVARPGRGAAGRDAAAPDFDLTDWTCVSHPGRFFPTEGAKVNHDAVMHKEAIQSESIGRAVAPPTAAPTAPRRWWR